MKENTPNMKVSRGYAKTIYNIFLFYDICKRESMFSTIRVGPAASGRGLCDIDKYYIELRNQVS